MNKFKELIEKAESERGIQLTFASTPKEIPAIRSKALFTGVVGDRKHYAFVTEEDREQFVYDRDDTLFTNSKDLRSALGLSPAVGRGTVVISPPPASGPKTVKRNKYRK